MDQRLTVVILAAGLGTRMNSRKAKVLHKAGGLTLVEHVVNTALELTTPERVVVVVGHQAAQVQATLAPSQVRFALQTEQKGTGHALAVCAGAVADQSGLTIVLYGDGPLMSAATLRDLVEKHQSSGAAATLITTILEDPTGYGRILLDPAGNVDAIVEEKVVTPEQRAMRLINSGIYCFNSELLWKHLPELKANPVSKEYYLTDFVEILNYAGYKVRPYQHPDPNELMGINTRLELAVVDKIFRERKVRQLMLDGVTIERPETVTIDMQVKIGIDTVVGPFTQILGATVIGEDCAIGAGSILRNSHLAENVEISPYTLIDDSRLEKKAAAGPFARLRMNAHVEAEAHVGNFVELKKTRLGAGAKAMHLAYLGDSTIGARTNIGAGTITCNYDGAKKHQTTIGAGAFVGSNSTLVAPVEVGEGSYIAAGSVVTNAVPPDALAIGRGRQENKEGWAKRRREKAAAKL
jgi:bifunctional UDP-N-acetylglucosamine pyrophosphorylase / glucosamine-1-phosphate N-acetyltransferase